MPNEVKLLPCPFCCCGDREMPPVLTVTKEGPVVICTACSAMGPTRRTEAEAIAAWNDRPTTVVTDEVVERMRDALTEARRYIANCWIDPVAADEENALLAKIDSALASMPTVVTGEQPA